MARGRIDVPHHFFPAILNKGKLDPKIGFKTPSENIPWTPDISLKFMDDTGIDTAILSFPVLASGSVSEQNCALARQVNLDLAKIRDANPSRLGFFANMPFLHDIEGEYKTLTKFDRSGLYFLIIQEY